MQRVLEQIFERQVGFCQKGYLIARDFHRRIFKISRNYGTIEIVSSGQFEKSA